MSLVLQPQNYFTVVHQIPNHLDVATYYIKAVIRNAYTDEIIDTLELENKGSQRFKKDWRVPADPSGQGFYISIVTSVYTDSGYTTKSENYGDDENTYLIQDRITVGRIGGNGGGGVDAFDVRRIIKEELTSMHERMKKEEDAMENDTEEETDEEKPPFDEILIALSDIKAKISEPETDEDEKMYQIMLDKLEIIKQAINDKEVTESTDLAPVLEQIKGVKDHIDTVDSGISKSAKEMINNVSDNLGKVITNAINSALKETTFNLHVPFENLPFRLDANPESKKSNKERDITQLL